MTRRVTSLAGPMRASSHALSVAACSTIRRAGRSTSAPGSMLLVCARSSQRRGLLALTTGSGRVVYPAFQFDAHGVVAGLAEVLERLPADLVSRWTVASWLVSDDADLGATPIAVLLTGRLRPVMEAASRWATALDT